MWRTWERSSELWWEELRERLRRYRPRGEIILKRVLNGT
jgi:hypothetical protein